MLLSIENLQLKAGATPVVDGATLKIDAGRTHALVGESGSGKSLTALAILRLLPAAVRHTAGRIIFQERDLTVLSSVEMRRLRGGSLAMIFQEPQSCLNPVLTIGAQLSESLRLQRGLYGAAARRRAVELLRQVRIAAPETRLQAFPHELSGGMRQRVMIAMALAGEPSLLIADEPTTALDATIAIQIVVLLQELQRQTGLAILFITHDLGIVATLADEVSVMQAGKIVEAGSARQILSRPQHPYTQNLLAAAPRLGVRPAFAT